MARASIIIPVYNTEEFIRQTLECALNQTYAEKEVIVVDDASTDRTPQILKDYKDRIIYIRNEENLERSKSRNKGVELSTGEFIFFLDADDLWERDYVESVVEYLRDYDIVYSFPRTLIDREGRVKRRSKKRIPQDVGEVVFSGMIGYPSASAFKRSSFPEYAEDVITREDWEVYIRAYLKGLSIKVLDNDKVYIRDHGKRSTKTQGEKFYGATKVVFERYKDKIPREYYPYLAFHYAETAMRFGHLSEGWKALAGALSRKPTLLLNSRRLLSILKRGFRVKFS